jgi:quinol monooxygenase YgiN
MIISIVNIKASSDRREELCRALSSLSGPTEAEAGCISYQLFEEVSEPGVLRVESRWNTQNDLLRHIRSDTYRRLLLLMELGAEPPTIEFYTVSELRGFDLIVAARRRSNLPEAPIEV